MLLFSTSQELFCYIRTSSTATPARYATLARTNFMTVFSSSSLRGA